MAKSNNSNNPIEDLADLKDHFNKKYGEGAVRFGGDKAIVSVEAVPTGVVAIDDAIGCRGIPRGRILEIFGPESSGKTTLCLKIASSFQHTMFGDRLGRAAFVDVEHAFDPEWARKIGVNVDELIFSQPDYAEQAYDIVEMIAKSRKVEVILLDSVAAMAPKSEIEGTLEDNNAIGAQARLNSQAFRKLKGILADTKCTLICVNQIREKIGVMFGCLHADTLIPFVDGRVLPIRQIVDEKIEGEVWSFNEKTNEFEAKRIVDWHYNGEVEVPEDYLHVTLRGPGTKNGAMQITVTPSHEVLHHGEFVPMHSLDIGDSLTTKQDSYVFNFDESLLNGSMGEFLSGILSGDSHISRNANRFGATLKIRDNIDYQYADWKADLLHQAGLTMTKHRCRSGYYYSSKEIAEFAQIKHDYPNRDPMLLLKHFSWLGFAVWIMDDAVYERGRYQLSIKRFAGNHDKLHEISGILDELGLFHHMSRGGRITFDVNSSEFIADNIYKFIPQFMDRKLPPHRRDLYQDVILTRDCLYRSADVSIVDIRRASQKQMKQKGKYDLSVEDNHNYMAGGNPIGVIVHNSPETTPGGRALKFYASVRMDIRRTGSFKIGDAYVGNETRVKFVKNKVAPPFTLAEFNITFGVEQYPIYGVDPYSSLIELGKTKKIITQSGSHFKYDGVNLGNGMANAAITLAADPKLFQKLYEHVVSGVQNKECLTQPPSTNEETLSTSENQPQQDS